jgi:hypothetical protein
MMVNHITGSLTGGPLSAKPAGLKSSGFDRVLLETTASLEKNLRSLHGGMETPKTGAQPTAGAGKLVKIGTITSKNPTVSDLLIRNPVFKKECWHIVHNHQNQDKAYRRIRAGTDIYLNPGTKELLWGDMIQNAASAPGDAGASPVGGHPERANAVRQAAAVESGTYQVNVVPGEQAGGLSENLVNAVESMIGKTYLEIDCFELLVSGLSKLGIRYVGHGGLGHELIARAIDDGLPMNAYLNGEGLVKFSGAKVYDRSFSRVSDPAGQAGTVIQEMAPYLEKGSILSFSMESRGHTGIVSCKDGTWTYINSGVMDNPVTGGITPKGVGEENLYREIENWFQLAARRNESLVITLGKLSQHKLAGFDEKNKLTFL